MSRLIDADDIIEFIKNVYCPECDNYNGVRCRACPINDMIEAIDDAPTVDLWHYPSKGELPTEDASYLVTLEHLRGFKERFRSTASYHKEYGWGGFEPLFYRVVAWMPLPEPPKEEA